MDSNGWADVAAALADVDFPANKQDLVNHARVRQVDDRTLNLVRSLPVAVYRNLVDVRDALRRTPEDDPPGARPGQPVGSS
jgi:hypothetical protein